MNERLEQVAVAKSRLWQIGDGPLLREGMLLQVYVMIREVYPAGCIVGDVVLPGSFRFAGRESVELTKAEAILCDVVGTHPLFDNNILK